MGTKVASKYAYIFMHQLETKLMSQSSKKLFQYLRYIDEIWMVWTHEKDTLLEFIDNVNRLHSTIKFTYPFSPETVNLLDTTVHLINNEIETELYTKHNDTHQYLLPSSCHIIKNIPKSLAPRIKRICSTIAYFEKHAACLTSYLVSRSYKEKHIRKIIDEVRTIPRKNLLKSILKSTSEKTSFITTFRPGPPKFNLIFN